MQINSVSLGDQHYPTQLTRLSSPPKSLYYLGNIDLLKGPLVSIVGSRKVTAYGKAVTELLAEDLAQTGIHTVSGLAFGVDVIGHTATNKAGGNSIAVMAGGLDDISPKSNRHIAINILQNHGLLLSEYPEKTRPYKQHFIARNRIVAGLSKAIIITEAAEKSGSLHTAQFAIDNGIPVCCVPGNITSPLSAGTNSLLKSGAHLITCAQDVLEIIGLANYVNPKSAPLAANSAEATIIDLLQQGISDASTLQLQSKLSPDVFNQTLTMLEITGKVTAQGANQWSI